MKFLIKANKTKIVILIMLFIFFLCPAIALSVSSIECKALKASVNHQNNNITSTGKESLAPLTVSHQHDGVTFDNELSSYQATLGIVGQTTSYVLTADFTATDEITILGAVNLCLNGFTVDMKQFPIEVKNSEFNVYNTGEELNGQITGSKSSGVIQNWGVVNIYGGIISASLESDLYGGCICFIYSGTFSVYGGKIKGLKETKPANITVGNAKLNISGDVEFENALISLNVTGEIDAAGYTGSPIPIKVSSYATVGNYIAKNISVEKVNLLNEHKGTGLCAIND